MAPEREEQHHPEGVVEKDHAYRESVKEKIITGTAPNKLSLVTVFANTLLEMKIPAANVGPGGYAYTCGCRVTFQGVETMISVCEGHR